MKRARRGQNPFPYRNNKRFIGDQYYDLQQQHSFRLQGFNNQPQWGGQYPSFGQQYGPDLKNFTNRRPFNSFGKKRKHDPTNGHSFRNDPSTRNVVQSSDGQVEVQFKKEIETKIPEGEVLVTIQQNDTNFDRQIAVVSPAPVEVKKQCTDCPESPYMICHGLSENIISTLKSNPPEFIQELNKFVKINKVHSSIKIFCANCSSGPINDWDKVVEHLIGKTHKHKVKGDDGKFIKIILCSTCYKVRCYSTSEESTDHTNIPDNIAELLKKIFPLAKTKGNVNVKKKRPGSLDFIFSNLKHDCDFVTIFDKVSKFGCDNSLNLMSIVCVIEPSDQIALCRYNRSHCGQNKTLFQRGIFFNGCNVKTELVPCFDGILEKAYTMKNQKGYAFRDWSIGSLAPTCEIFSNWNQLENLINSKIREMNETSKEYYQLTSSISEDLRRSIFGYFCVTSINFFGSRVTGLALKQSDFDLQIAIEGQCSVRNLCDKCLYKSPWFSVQDIIPSAKVPIIKLLHKKSKTLCDVSLNNVNGVINSQLLRFYLEMDPRVKWLVVTVKMWASMNFITGSFNFTSYTLAWLVLFFLMQKDVSLVPHVQLLTSLTTSDNSCILISEETGMRFTLDMKQLLRVHDPRLKCHKTNRQLLVDFFDYYNKVLPLKKALDPYSGELIPRVNLLVDRKKQIEGNLSYSKGVWMYSLIILDPIKHSSNISASVTNERLKSFLNLAQQTLRLLSQTSNR